MKPVLNPSHVPVTDPHAQLLTLKDGRLLLRHKGGFSFLNGLNEKDVRLLIHLVDGVRTQAEILDLSPFERKDTALVLQELAGLLIFTQPPPAPLSPLPEPLERSFSENCLMVGNGPWSQQLAHGLGLDHDSLRAFKGGVGKKRLVVAVLEKVPLHELAELQRLCFRDGLSLLPIYTDPYRLVMGPLSSQGQPCAACAATSLFGAPDGVAISDILRLETGPAPWSAAGLSVLGAELEKISQARSELVGGVLRLQSSWTASPAAKKPECPVCGHQEAQEKEELALQWQRLATFENRGARQLWEKDLQTVGILGGGTAGYLTALALRAAHPQLRVVLLESDRVPVIGVGEATTPLMPQFLHVDLGLDIHELFREVQPTLKLGIRFQWGEGQDGFNYPFGPVRVLDAFTHESHILNCSLQSQAMNALRVPVTRNGESFLGLNTAYHLENRRFVAWLQKKAAQRGVEIRTCHIKDVQPGSKGVAALITEDGQHLSFDLYVDCSGFASLLMEKTQGSEFVDFSAGLFTDRAVIASLPHQGVIKPYTLAEAMDAGWCWNTPQMNEDHRGYVFSSAFIEDQQAVDEMKRKNPAMGEPRVIRFRAGRHTHFWKGNVVAMGNAYGFVEPLESTALHMLIRQIGLLTRHISGNSGLQDMLNRKVNGWWDYLYWFLTLHYKFNRKMDTAFWRACREDIDVSSHGELLEAFGKRGPLSAIPEMKHLFTYPDPLWGPEGVDILLLGQNVETPPLRPHVNAKNWKSHVRDCSHFLNRCQTHEQALKSMAEHPEILKTMAARFRQAGPAFTSAP